SPTRANRFSPNLSSRLCGMLVLNTGYWILDAGYWMLVENWHFAFVSSLCLGALVAMIFEMGFKMADKICFGLP
ncbi:MAG: hypothetical protein ACK5XL_15345, partial [Cyclobacteriaceae bacterium]